MRNLLERAVDTAFYGRFLKLRDLQEAAIEPLLNGKNVIMTSGTGSGKTEAVVAPLVSKYWKNAVKEDLLFLLYIAPTKALVNDIEKRLSNPASLLHLRIGIRHGDRDDLHSKSVPHILITTPESLDVMLFRKEKALMTIKAIIIDEVHLFYNSQRGLQLSILIQRLQIVLHKQVQIVALSATIGNLEYVKEFVSGHRTEYECLSFLTSRCIDAQIRVIDNDTKLLPLIKKVTNDNIIKILVFVNSRQECETLSGILQEDLYLKNIVFTHYSSLSTGVRLEIEEKFSSLQTAICVATSTLELGIDIGDIGLVILWGLPSGIDSFLQRIGRSNRRANKTNVVCIVPPTSKSCFIDCLMFLSLCNAAMKGEMPMHMPYEIFGAIGQQCLSIIGSENGAFTRIADLYETLKHEEYLKRDILEEILDELVKQKFLQKHGYKNRFGGEENLYKLIDYKLIYGNFPTGSKNIDLFYETKRLGDIPVENLLRIHLNCKIQFAGKLWRVKKVTKEKIMLEPYSQKTQLTKILYRGKGITYKPEEINRIWKMIFTDDLPQEIFTNELKNKIKSIIIKIKEICTINSIPYTYSVGKYTYFTFAGSITNHAISLFFNLDDIKFDDISLTTEKFINWTNLPVNYYEYSDYYDMFFEESSSQSIYQTLLPQKLQSREYIQSWVKNPAIDEILHRLQRSKPIKISSLPVNLT